MWIQLPNRDNKKLKKQQLLLLGSKKKLNQTMLGAITNRVSKQKKRDPGERKRESERMNDYLMLVKYFKRETFNNREYDANYKV